jgi:hypothetical protein
VDKDTRNTIERATQRARKLLEEDFAAQLEGDFDIHRSGAVTAKAGPHVVPKCATDRSLAIAHGLEDVFWIEGSDGKWTARKTPARSVEELVRERTSPR